VRDLGILLDFKVKILLVLRIILIIFKYIVVNYIILKIIRYANEYMLAKVRDKIYNRILA
jgi:hypothetical protein